MIDPELLKDNFETRCPHTNRRFLTTNGNLNRLSSLGGVRERSIYDKLRFPC